MSAFDGAAATAQRCSQGSPTIRVVTFDDYDAIASVLGRNGLSIPPFDEWREGFTTNPAYQERGGDWPIGWVLESGRDGIVGVLGNIPTVYCLNGRRLLTATACGWAVDEAYRAYSLMLLHRLTKQPNVDLLLCTTVSKVSEPGYQAFDWARVPRATWDKSGMWITNRKGFAGSVLRTKGIPMEKQLSYLAAGALSIGARLVSAGSSKVSRGPEEIDLRADFDSDFDTFWDAQVHENSRVLLAVRTREALNWHYRRAMNAQMLWIVTASRHGRMLAYAVVDRSDSPAALKRARIVDLQALEGEEALGRSILSWITHRCREERIDVLENFGCWLECENRFQITAPHHRTLASWTFYYKAPERYLHEALKEPQSWAPTSYDGDASL